MFQMQMITGAPTFWAGQRALGDPALGALRTVLGTQKALGKRQPSLWPPFSFDIRREERSVFAHGHTAGGRQIWGESPGPSSLRTRSLDPATCNESRFQKMVVRCGGKVKTKCHSIGINGKDFVKAKNIIDARRVMDGPGSVILKTPDV